MRYEKFFALTSATDIGWAKSCALAGCLVGSLVAGVLSDKFGSKRLLILSAVLFTVSSLATGLANTFPVLVAWRIVGGAAIGFGMMLAFIAAMKPDGLYRCLAAPEATQPDILKRLQRW